MIKIRWATKDARTAQVLNHDLGTIFVLDIEEPMAGMIPSPLTGKPFLAMLSEGESSRRLRKRPDAVDFATVKTWLSRCQEHHGPCNEATRTESNPTISVIDCQKFEVIGAGPEMKYAALSYVWGSQISSTELTGEDAFQFCVESLPPLIRGAVQATISCGLRYLWIDRYCLPRSGDAQRHEQISKMNTIYGNAELTLVALVDSPNEHLPGVPLPGADHPRAAQHSYEMGDSILLSSMSPPRAAIEQSTWWKRAWTLQEAVLSRRCLYFSHEQVYFECRVSHQCETLEFEPTSRELEAGIVGPWPDHRKYIVHPTDKGAEPHHGNDPNNLLRVYFRRALSHDSDAINAFAGILERYASIAAPWAHHYGLLFRLTNPPHVRAEETTERDEKAERAINNAFLRALTWQASNSSRRPGFPSWSWAGWKGDMLLTEAQFSYSDLSSLSVEWETVDGHLKPPGKAFLDRNNDIALIQWSQCIILEGPTLDIELLPAASEDKEGNITLLMKSGPDGEDEVLLACAPWYWSSDVVSSRYTRIVALKALSTKYEASAKDDFLLVFGQKAGSDLMERLGLIPQVGDAITQRLPHMTPGTPSRHFYDFGRALNRYVKAPWGSERLRVG